MIAKATKRVVQVGWLVSLGALMLASQPALADTSLTALDATVTQNFDSLPSSGSATFTNNSTIPGWYSARTGTGATIIAGDGSSNTGGLYSFGTTGSTERALGSVGSATPGNLYWGTILQNNTGATITSLDVSYNGEQWRNGGNATAQTVTFTYATGSAITGSLSDFQASGTAVSALDFTSLINTTTAAALNGNAAANRSAKTATITGLSIPNGGQIFLRWLDIDHTGSDHGLSIDDVSITPHGAAAGAPSFSINNVTMAEGNSGTTAFVFTVTLSNPNATTSTVDYATGGGTATAGSDYASTSGTLSFPAGTITQTISVSVNGDTTAEPDETFNVVLSNAVNGSISSGTGVGTITNDDAAAPSARIYDIQGGNHVSPLVGMSVTNVPGIVTAVCATGCTGSKGFYLQDATGDGNNNTSDGIFVFTSSAPTVAIGDSITVSGTVSEFRQTTAGTACEGSIASGPCLRLTEITSPTISKLSSGNALPAPVVIGSGGRVIPNQSIYSGSTQVSVEDANYPFNAAVNAIDFFETLEGMRVQVNNSRVVSPSKVFSSGTEFWVVPDQYANSNVSPNDSGGITVTDYSDPQPEKVQIDSGLTGSPQTVTVGDSVAGSIVGVMGYSFANYELLYTSVPSVTSGGLAKGASPFTTVDATHLSVAAYNVENLGGNGAQAKFDTIGSEVVNRLKSPDIISVSEVQDNNGATDDGTVSATTTIQRIIDAITAAGGPTYSTISINPVNDQDGGQPGGNIRIVLFYNANRVTFVPGTSGAGDSTTATAATSANGKLALTLSPGRVSPTDSAFNSSRKPLAATFDFNGQRVVVIGNHLNSKGGDDAAFGRLQPPGRSSEVQRHNQATILYNFVSSLYAQDPKARVVLMGDLNDFGFSGTLSILRTGTDPASSDPAATKMHNLGEELINPPSYRHSYVFDGVSQELDHILVSNSLISSAAFKAVRFNSEFPDQTSDHDPLAARLLVDCQAGTLNLSAASYSVGESGGSATITAQRSGGSCGAVGVSYATASAAASSTTATAGTDYTAASGTLSWADGDTTDKTFTVTILDDQIDELDEVFGAALSGATGGATLGSTSSASVTITDDDATPTVRFSQVSSSAGEGAGMASIAVELVGNLSSRDVLVPITVGGTATRAASTGDYTLGNLDSMDRLTIPAGSRSASVTVSINDDSAVEGDETVVLGIGSGVMNAGTGSDQQSHTLTITDNDTPPQDTTPDAFSFITRSNVAPGSQVTSEAVTITGFTGTLTATVSNGGQCSINGGPFAATCSITPGQTLTVRHTAASDTSTQKDSIVAVGNTSATFSSITSTADRVPDDFSFGTTSNVAPSTLIESPAITLTGINAPAVIEAPASAFEYSVNGGPWSSARGSYAPGDSIKLRHTSSSRALGFVTSTVRIGGVDGSFTTRTRKVQ